MYRMFYIQPTAEINELFSPDELMAKIPKLRELSPILVADIEACYKDKGGLRSSYAQKEMQKYWIEYFQTESMLEDLKEAGLLSSSVEEDILANVEIPLRRMAAYEKWVELFSNQLFTDPSDEAQSAGPRH